ncbi:2-dehydro-3-deoxy-6-phosphogalactonate aldolase [Geobacillus sp. BCO2]|nr:2-dehydro-3-deoxy-6-phosphogalactonate aldolase [Geobacillus sp. BCO2]
MSVYFEIEQKGIISILRHTQIDTIELVAEVLKSAGITVLEVTMETPKASNMIEKLRAEFSDCLTIGAGTVLDAETAKVAISAGAQFIVSPTINIETIRIAKRYGVLCIPGAMTPTEVLTAYEHGADMVKNFSSPCFGSSVFQGDC